MILLDDTTTTLEIDLAAAITTNQLQCVASYTDIKVSTAAWSNAKSQTTNTNNTTAVTLVSAPASGYSRKIQYVSVYNADTVAAVVTAQLNENGTVKGLVTFELQPGETLQMADGEGWRLLAKKSTVSIKAGDSPSVDSFGRWRVSTPQTIRDIKQIHDTVPLLINDVEASGAGTSTAWSQDEAATTISVGATTAGKRIRQTYERFAYQPGKTTSVIVTFSEFDTATGITKEVGLFDDDNGLFFRSDEGTLSVVRRSNVTGTPVDEVVAQSSWNLDKLNGTGESGITLDASKAQIGLIDFSWLGVGRVRMGFKFGSQIVYVHEFLHSNVLSTVYMSTPNLPGRYSIENDGAGAADDFVTICFTVASEAGLQSTGMPRGLVTGTIGALAGGTSYAIAGIRLKSGNLDGFVTAMRYGIGPTTLNDLGTFTWRLNPTVAGVFTYSDQTNSVVQTATGAVANTVTGGTIMDAGFYSTAAPALNGAVTARHIGSSYTGTRDEMVLCCTPIANQSVKGILTWIEG